MLYEHPSLGFELLRLILECLSVIQDQGPRQRCFNWTVPYLFFFIFCRITAVIIELNLPVTGFEVLLSVLEVTALPTVPQSMLSRQICYTPRYD